MNSYLGLVAQNQTGFSGVSTNWSLALWKITQSDLLLWFVLLPFWMSMIQRWSFGSQTQLRKGKICWAIPKWNFWGFSYYKGKMREIFLYFLFKWDLTPSVLIRNNIYWWILKCMIFKYQTEKPLNIFNSFSRLSFDYFFYSQNNYLNSVPLVNSFTLSKMIFLGSYTSWCLCTLLQHSISLKNTLIHLTKLRRWSDACIFKRSNYNNVFGNGR